MPQSLGRYCPSHTLTLDFVLAGLAALPGRPGPAHPARGGGAALPYPYPNPLFLFWQGSPRYQGDLDLLIQRAEAERLQTLSELQPLFRDWQGIKARPDAGSATRSAALLQPSFLHACVRLRGQQADGMRPHCPVPVEDICFVQ